MAEFRDVAKAYKRLCDSQETCKDCVLGKLASNAVCCEEAIVKCPEEAERIIMQWAKENPLMTNRMRFEEVFGCGIVTHEIHEAIPGHVEILNASDEEFEEWLNAEYKGER